MIQRKDRASVSEQLVNRPVLTSDVSSFLNPSSELPVLAMLAYTLIATCWRRDSLFSVVYCCYSTRPTNVSFSITMHLC